MKNTIDIFNGDADGLLARHQFRLSHPIAAEDLTLVSGIKRDIALLDRVVAARTAHGATQINVFDISYDRNVLGVRALLDAGAHITYFDHHRASQFQPHLRLHAHIDESAGVCTSLLVDRYCHGAHRLWAISAAFGDNLTAVGEKLSAEERLSASQAKQLRELGECLNYNAYGESLEDLYYDPVALAIRLQPYADPFDFIAKEDVLPNLSVMRKRDLTRAQEIAPMHASDVAAVIMLPDQSWARRVSGEFANHLALACPDRAHAVMTPRRGQAGRLAKVSIRAPIAKPRDAASVAARFGNGGGRATAAGIDEFSVDQLPALIAALEETWRG